MQISNPLKLGVIGIGAMGRAHATNLLEGKVQNVTLAALADTNPAALADFSQVKCFSDGSSLIQSGEVDAVLISTPHYSHTSYGIEALEKGLHVLVEKPISASKADALRLVAAHRNPEQIFGAMFDTRTEPRYIRLRELVKSGDLGRIRRINWIITTWFRSDTYYRSSDWRATWAGEGGGILINQLPHDLDLLQWIFGMPQRVRAFCPIGKEHDIEVEDEVNAIFEYADGATGVLVAGTGEAPGTDRREIVGDWGRVLVYSDRLEFTRNEVRADEFCRTTPERFAIPERWENQIPVRGTAGRHCAVIQAFVNAILEGKPLVAKAEEGIASIELANAITHSSDTGLPVEFPLDAEVYEAALAKKKAASRYEKREPSAVVITDMSGSFK